MRDWTVAGALIRNDAGLLLVGNRRRSGVLEWTPPGGVVDPGETVRGALAREVFEETGLHVESWGSLAYTVQVEAPGLGWRMRVEAWEITAVRGEIVLDDPDGIVEEARHVAPPAVAELLADSPMWVREPVTAWLSGIDGRHHDFVLHGTRRDDTTVQRR